MPTSPAVRDFSIGPGFWSRAVNLVREHVIPYQWETLNDRVPGAEPSHCVENFRIAAGEAAGEYYGMVFQDSDIAKWLEAVAYSLATRGDTELEATADEVISLIGRSQQPDGYLNTYYTVKEPGRRWTNLRDCHELYCAGHMMEAAVAYFEATGKRALLDIMSRMAHHIDSVIGAEEGKLRGIPGHQEIELALVRMYGATKDPVMLKLAKYFIDERGGKPNFFETEHEKRGGEYHFPLHLLGASYNQNHLPIREQEAFEGHSVRALYMAAGMASVAKETGDEALVHACRRLFDNMVEHRMYITGGIGSSHHGEAFTFDDDLPNDTAYNETCASVALCFFTRAMLQLETDSRYADAMERALYNTCLAGMSLDGHTFFYVNPLEVWPEASHRDPGKRHVLPVRPPWFRCACCPPNLARLVMSLGAYAYSLDPDEVTVHLFIDGSLKVGDRTLKVETRYPYDGVIRCMPGAGKYALNLRIPGYVDTFSLSVNGEKAEYSMLRGYARIRREWAEGDVVTLSFALVPRRVYPNARLVENVGRVAIMRGPLVYCIEGADNGDRLRTVALAAGTGIDETWREDKLGGIVELEAAGTRLVSEPGKPQYMDEPPGREPVRLTFIPYFTWANRGENEMVVWMMEG